MGKRVLITGLASFWGGLVAQALESEPDVDVIIGLDTSEPSVPLERTEYVRTDESYSILARIVKAAAIDTIVHTFLVVDSTSASERRMHEINVIGTMNLFAAASAPGSTVRAVVVKSSAYVYGATRDDPTWFREITPRRGPPRSAVEQSLYAVEGYVRDFAQDNPHVDVALLRFSNVLGPDLTTPLSRALELPLVPTLLGFDPRFQFVHELDVTRSICFAIDRSLAGVYNVAGDGLLPWSEVIAMAGKHPAPIPPYGASWLAMPLRLIGVELPEEVLALLRYGRGIDNRRLKRAGFDYRFDSAGVVADVVEHMRLRRSVGRPEPAYQYQRDVEQFFRHSPAVIRNPNPPDH